MTEIIYKGKDGECDCVGCFLPEAYKKDWDRYFALKKEGKTHEEAKEIMLYELLKKRNEKVSL